jgi:hypothetical protein
VTANPAGGRTGRSIWAVTAGIVANVVLSLGTDQLFHVLDVYPPWGQRMTDNLFILALSYRLVYGAGSGYLTAWLAPRNPMKHAMILGVIGTALGLAGAIANGNADLGPAWYTYGLAASAIPTVWLGASIVARKR